MSRPSNWPLPPDGIRYALPDSIVQQLARHPLSRDLYPRVFGYYPDAQGHRMRRDRHDDYLMIFCSTGRGQLDVETKPGTRQRFDIRAGDLILLSPGQSHRYEAHRQQPWTIFWLHFSGELADHYLEHLGVTPEAPVCHLGVAPKLLAEFHELMAPRLSGNRINTLIHQSLALKELLGYCALQRRRQDEQRTGAFDLDTVHTFMQQHIRQPLSLETLAGSVGLSRHHFARIYKQMTGETPIQHFLQLKMQHACFLLEVSDRQVQDVAQELGYEDAYYFSRLFKRIIGLAPDHYRRTRLQH